MHVATSSSVRVSHRSLLFGARVSQFADYPPGQSRILHTVEPVLADEVKESRLGRQLYRLLCEYEVLFHRQRLSPL